MRKLLLICLIALTCFCSVAWQNTYTEQSEEVQNLYTLANLSSTALPILTYPVSRENMLTMLDMINTEDLGENGLKLYNSLREKIENAYVILGQDGFGMDLQTPVLLFNLYNGEYEDKTAILAYKDSISIIEPRATVYLSEYFTGVFDFDQRIEQGRSKELTDNLHLDSVFILKDICHESPTVAYGSLGNKIINLSIGRNRISAGGAKTGNLSLSENQLFTDYAKLSIVGKVLSYDYTASVYDTGDTETGIEYMDFNSNVKAMYVHRLSAVFGKHLSLSLYEGAMNYGQGMFSDIRVLNPFMMIHNNYSYLTGYVNNFFGLDTKVSFSKGFYAGAQLMLDQFKLSTEASDSGENAFGVLVNAGWTGEVGEGILDTWAEFVYTSTTLYLKEKDNSFNTEAAQYFQTDLISSYKTFNAYDSDEFAYIGYPLGPGVVRGVLGASYLLNDYKFGLQTSFAVKKPVGIGENEDRAIGVTTYSSYPQEKRFSVTASVEGKAYEAVSYSAAVSFLSIWNHNHISDDNYLGVGFTFAIKVDPCRLIERKTI